MAQPSVPNYQLAAQIKGVETKLDNLVSQFVDFTKMQREVDKGQDAMIQQLDDDIRGNGAPGMKQLIAANSMMIKTNEKAIEKMQLAVDKVVYVGWLILVGLVVNIVSSYLH